MNNFINYFWNWISSAVNAGLSLFNSMLNNVTLSPFWQLFLVVFFVGMSIKYILQPLAGNIMRGSDKIRSRSSDKVVDAEYREIGWDPRANM